MIDDKMTWMSKVSIENVIRIKIISNMIKNNHANDVDKMMWHYINNVVIKLLYNDSKILSIIWYEYI